MHAFHWPQQPPSRREIDIAIGALIGLFRLSETEALEMIVDAVHATSAGLGAVSRALIVVVGRQNDSSESAAAIAYWQARVGATPPGDTTSIGQQRAS